MVIKCSERERAKNNINNNRYERKDRKKNFSYSISRRP